MTLDGNNVTLWQISRMARGRFPKKLCLPWSMIPRAKHYQVKKKAECFELSVLLNNLPNNAFPVHVGVKMASIVNRQQRCLDAALAPQRGGSMAETSIPPRRSNYRGDWRKRIVPAGGNSNGFLRESHGNGGSPRMVNTYRYVSDGFALTSARIPHRV